MFSDVIANFHLAMVKALFSQIETPKTWPRPKPYLTRLYQCVKQKKEETKEDVNEKEPPTRIEEVVVMLDSSLRILKICSFFIEKESEGMLFSEKFDLQTCLNRLKNRDFLDEYFFVNYFSIGYYASVPHNFHIKCIKVWVSCEAFTLNVIEFKLVFLIILNLKQDFVRFNNLEMFQIDLVIEIKVPRETIVDEKFEYTLFKLYCEALDQLITKLTKMECKVELIKKDSLDFFKTIETLTDGLVIKNVQTLTVERKIEENDIIFVKPEILLLKSNQQELNIDEYSFFYTLMYAFSF